MRTFLVGFWLLSAPLANIAEAQNWPSFRGAHASGVAEDEKLPHEWDIETGDNVRWKARLPGLSHASPIVWGNYIFVVTAVSSAGDDAFTPGLYGEPTASSDRSVHQWKLLALDKKTGDVAWERVAFEGVPKEKRHIKATYANATPATNGEVVVAFFGSQGLCAFDMDGELAWKRDLGHIDNGAYDVPDYEWGTASSPIIYKNTAIVQIDTQQDDYLLAVDLATGETVWKTERDEMPSWGTPTIYPGEDRAELITNAPKFIRGNDPATGKELWRLGPSSDITAPTPVFFEDLIVVVSGRRPVAPIYVIRAGAEGDISLAEGSSSSDFVLWSTRGRGSYMPSPLIYGGHLYVLQNQGIIDCYELRTGESVYRSRIPHEGSGFSGSPVAAGGALYLPSEDGDVFVVKAGPEFELLARNTVDEFLMSTPAISDGTLFIRAHRHLYAVGK